MTVESDYFESQSFGSLRTLADLLANDAGWDRPRQMNRDELVAWLVAYARPFGNGAVPDPGTEPMPADWQLVDPMARLVEPERGSIDAAALLEELAGRFRERNGKYKDNWRNLGDVMVALYPDGITLRTHEDFVKFHLLEWTIGKLTRYVNSDDGDSIEDGAVYMAMIGSYIRSLA
jgi:hypothetical protein